MNISLRDIKCVTEGCIDFSPNFPALCSVALRKFPCHVATMSASFFSLCLIYDLSCSHAQFNSITARNAWCRATKTLSPELGIRSKNCFRKNSQREIYCNRMKIPFRIRVNWFPKQFSLFIFKYSYTKRYLARTLNSQFCSFMGVFLVLILILSLYDLLLLCRHTSRFSSASREENANVTPSN